MNIARLSEPLYEVWNKEDVPVFWGTERQDVLIGTYLDRDEAVEVANAAMGPNLEYAHEVSIKVIE